MANAFEDERMPSPERYDGAFRCRLCPDRSPQDDNDWCPVARAVLCEDCCRALMMGDERVFELAERHRREPIEPEQVIDACMQCERLFRLVSETAVEGESEGVRLPMH